MKRVVVFGAGLVARPLVRYLLDHGLHVTVASRTVSKAERLIAKHPNGRAAAVSADDEAAIGKFVAESDLAVSLLPAPKHPLVARACLDSGRHMVTTSYVGPDMLALDAEARAKDLLLLNEIGVDPGIDHMSAMQVIHAERERGGALVGFSSWCGGLPAPEANDNPFGYKFSWSPRAVLVAARNSARYLRDGQLVQIAPADLFATPATVEVPGVGTFEGYPNRDSVSYLDTYEFDKQQVTSMFRGTLRNLGHCKLYTQIIQLGLIEASPEHDTEGLTCGKFVEKLLGGPAETTIPKRLGVAPADSPVEALRYIGLLSDEPIAAKRISTLDLMAERMAQTLVYAPSERDMLLMRHDLTFAYETGKRERITAIMVDYGIAGGDSSMARTVSLPAAIGVRMILEGKIPSRGVRIPITPNIYEPILAELSNMGIGFTETRTAL
jgi:saccharopine dehydrogenase-like NADP-dependent oxidoreductase